MITWTRSAALAAFALAAAAGNTAHRSPPAQLRFANRTGGTVSWSVANNGKVVFDNIAANTVTGYVPIADTVSRLTLVRPGTDTVISSTTYQFVSGSYYTVTATFSNGERPILTVERDRPPGDSGGVRR